MDQANAQPLARGTYRATISGVGLPGPIEERVGCRLVRLVDPASREGQSLVRTRQVSFIGPEGITLGRVDLVQARRMLELRLRSVLSDSGAAECAEAIREGLHRLRRAAPRRD